MRGWHGVGLVAGWQTVASLCFYAIFAATAFLRAEFGLSRTLVGVIITVTMLGYTLLLFVVGAAVDGYGERRVMVGGLLAPPTFGYLVDTVGYTAGWVALAGGVAVAALLTGWLTLLTRA